MNWATTSFETFDDKTIYLLYVSAEKRNNLAAMTELVPVIKARMGITTLIPRKALIDAFRRRVFSHPVNVPQEPELIQRDTSLREMTIRDIDEIYRNFFEDNEDLFQV